MNCTICKSKLIVSAIVFNGDGKELDCPNPKCDWRTTDSFVIVKNNWWYAHTYQLPFSLVDGKYFVCGPSGSDKCIVYSYDNKSDVELKINDIISIGSIRLNSPIKNIMEIDYMALPTNQDFEQEFAKLKTNIQKYLLLK